MHCFSQRSVIAMTYPPENLTEVIANKGVLQRMLLFVKEVPEHEQHRMRLEQLSKAGTFEVVNQPLKNLHLNSMQSIRCCGITLRQMAVIHKRL